MRSVNLSECSAFKYEGGKATIRPWIARFIPFRGRAYIEPFAGRGNVFFLMGNICDYQRWQLNDMRTGLPGGFLPALLTVEINDIPTHIKMTDEQHWRDLRIAGAAIGAIMESVTTHNSITYDKGRFQGSGHPCHGDVKDGVYGNYTKVGLSTRIMLSRDIMKRNNVEITALDYTQLPWDTYTSEDFVYLDPPYLKASVGCYSENDMDPEQFVHTLKKTRARWIVSEYEQPIYTKAFGKPAAEYNTVMVVNKATKYSPYRKEVLYANFPIRFRPIRFVRSSEAKQSTLEVLKSAGPVGVTVDNMTRTLASTMNANKVKAELANLKYHPYVLYNGLKYWWMGGNR